MADNVNLVDNIESTYPSFTANMGLEIANVSWENIQNKPEIPPQYLRGVYSTEEFTDPTFPLPLDESWQPPLINGSYVMVGEAGTNATVYIADLSDNIWVSLGGGSGGVPTPEEIKALYESNADTNAYTDAAQTAVNTYAKPVTTTTPGAMSAADKAKLDTIQGGARAYGINTTAIPAASVKGMGGFGGSPSPPNIYVSAYNHRHPEQVDISGDAGTAGKLRTPATLDVDLTKTTTTSFDGQNGQVASLGVKGILPVTQGGTGVDSIQNIYADLSENAANNALVGNIGVRGILPIAKGGTGVGSTTANSIPYIDSDGDYAFWKKGYLSLIGMNASGAVQEFNSSTPIPTVIGGRGISAGRENPANYFTGVNGVTVTGTMLRMTDQLTVLTINFANVTCAANVSTVLGTWDTYRPSSTRVASFIAANGASFYCQMTVAGAISIRGDFALNGNSVGGVFVIM